MELSKKLLKAIRKASKKALRWRRKAGFKDARDWCKTEPKAILSYHDFIAGTSTKEPNEADFVFTYERADGYFGAERLVDGRLKEFYEWLLPPDLPVLDKSSMHFLIGTDEDEDGHLLLSNGNKVFRRLLVAYSDDGVELTRFKRSCQL
jgi:hypothetical protein